MLGILLICGAFLLLVAMFSYDRRDLDTNFIPTGERPPVHNLIGRFGATLGDRVFLVLGASAYLLPVVLIGFGLANLIPALAYLRRRWVWALVLLLTCSAALDLAMDPVAHDKLARNLPAPEATFVDQLTLNMNAPSAGGVLGLNLNRYVFGYFGPVGSAILFTALYLISLYGLTNFHLGDWVRDWIERRRAAQQVFTGDEKGLDRRARDLEKQAKKLQNEIDRSAAREPVASPVEGASQALGPDLKPVPQPTVRDLSVPSLRSADAAKSKPAEPEAKPGGAGPADADEGPSEVIPATVVAATVQDIIGRPSEAPKVSPVTPSAVTPVSATELEVSKPVVKMAPTLKKPKPLSVAAPPRIGNYQLPPMDLLALPDLTVKPTESKEDLVANAKLMVQTLAQFGIITQPGDITKGPTITRYELHPSPGVKLEKITALTNNIAAALKAERIHILAPIPGKSSVGVEVPNLIKSKVIMRELLESEEWRHTKCRIPLALGKDVYGHPIVADLAEMPHLLIAGSTGSGKSVCINSIVASLLYRFPPDQLRFVMIDPKVVELQQYNALPHLVVPVVTDPKKVILALRWVVSEMEKRYQIFARVGVRNIKAFNDRPKDKPLPEREPELPLMAKKEKVEAGADGFAVEVDEEIVVPRDDDILIPDKLSYIVVIIDELADLMLVAPADVEMAIARITQMARAAGIHCIVATQRPSVDVITGVIKANFPVRMGFRLASNHDSKTIINRPGAEKLLGRGDMLIMPPGTSNVTRVHGAFISEKELHRVVEFLKGQAPPKYDMSIMDAPPPAEGGVAGDEVMEKDSKYDDAIEVVRRSRKCSTSWLQRQLGIGYNRAARIVEMMEREAIVGPAMNAKGDREIFLSPSG